MLCCDRLENGINAAGKRGIAVVIRRLPEFFIFYLQARAMALGEEEKLRELPIDARINLVSTIGIQFCPWCGRKLDDLAEAAPAVFSELAKRHEPFVSDF